MTCDVPTNHPPSNPLPGAQPASVAVASTGGDRAAQTAALERLLSDLEGAVATLAHSPDQATDPLARQLQGCIEQAQVISQNLEDLQCRLDHAENYLHEQTLQTLAHRTAARTDGLTGVANRRAFDSELAERCDDAFRSGAPLSLLLVDIDHFKRVNDVYGHTAGDAILRGVAAALRESLPAGCSLARYGGEEFAVVLPGIFIDHAVRLADELRENVASSMFRYEGQVIRVTISCGVAQQLPQEHWSVLIQRADAALYASKQAGRNRTHWHDASELRQSLPLGMHASPAAERTVDLDRGNAEEAAPLDTQGTSRRSRGIPGVARGNWCDSSTFFWYLRQRIAEWRRGGEPFTVFAIEVDQAADIKNRYGSRALHFIQRAQLLHLDASLRDMDVVGRLVDSRLAVVLPRTPLDEATPLLSRLIQGADRFAYPVGTDLLEYSVSIGLAGLLTDDDASQLVKRAEEALAEAQRCGRGCARVHDGVSVRPFQVVVEPS